MNSSNYKNLKILLREFAEVRDWNQFHSPKNLSMALSVEVSEIIEHFQWLTEDQSKSLPKDKLEEVETELADTFIYLTRLADELDIDLMDAAFKKIKQNEIKYPADKVRSSAKKYTENRFLHFMGLASIEKIPSDKPVSPDYRIRKLPLLDEVVTFSV